MKSVYSAVRIGSCKWSSLRFDFKGFFKGLMERLYCEICFNLISFRAGVHAPTKSVSVSVSAAISLLPPAKPRSGAHTHTHTHTHTDKIGIGAWRSISWVMQSSQQGSHVEWEVLSVVFASSPEETTSKAKRNRILGASYSGRKDTWRRLLYSLWETPRRFLFIYLFIY